VIFEQWQVAIVPFPFLERPAVKRRPALVVSTKTFNEQNGHTIFAMITAAMLEKWPSDYLINDPVAAGLVPKCYVRWKLFTLPNTMIIRLAGNFTETDRVAIKNQAQTFFVQA
jgi:mRNA interferase MazF